jgi:hypothetical protein
MEVCAICLIAVIAVWQVNGQQPSVPLRPPFGPANRLVSPDRAYALFGNDQAARLWLEDTRTHQRLEVVKATIQTLTLAWSPDSAAFIVNDRVVSDLEFSYIYNVKTWTGLTCAAEFLRPTRKQPVSCRARTLPLIRISARFDG